MMKIVLIALGGAIGSVGRYVLSSFAHGLTLTVFPVGTLLVNLVGSFLIGILGGVFEGSHSLSPQVRSFLLIGILGGFTTFSSYSLETLNLFRNGEMKLALVNFLLNNVLGILFALVGLGVVKQLQS